MVGRKPDLSKPWVRVAKFWRRMDKGKVQCYLCYKKCPIA
ncbi:MAG: AmmeMemoRadiSam system radical SAM enzyme, partial [Thermoprotei archaeon]